MRGLCTDYRSQIQFSVFATTPTTVIVAATTTLPIGCATVVTIPDCQNNICLCTHVVVVNICSCRKLGHVCAFSIVYMYSLVGVDRPAKLYTCLEMTCHNAEVTCHNESTVPSLAGVRTLHQPILAELSFRVTKYITAASISPKYLCAWGNVAVHEVKPRRDYCWLKTISNPPHSLASARLANF